MWNYLPQVVVDSKLYIYSHKKNLKNHRRNINPTVAIKCQGNLTRYILLYICRSVEAKGIHLGRKTLT